jgi:hypothetical protein
MSINKILFICGSLNQTKMMHEISKHLIEHECFFTPYYGDGFIKVLSKTPLLSNTILGGKFLKATMDYLRNNNLEIDTRGENQNYDLVFTCSDLIIPENIKASEIILVQEGMTDPENFMYHLVKKFNFPRWIASTSTTGLSDAYSKFCVASEGYKQHFINKGVNPDKIVITGIPNFDNCEKYINNNFPYSGYVLVATSDSRETYKFENRLQFINNAVKIADGRQLIFKLHPNENFDRAIWEINNYAPGSLIYTDGDIGGMIANCEALITKYSSVVFIGLALKKQVFSAFNIDELKKLMPIQNGGTSAFNIALQAEKILEEQKSAPVYFIQSFYSKRQNFIQRYRLRNNLPNEIV